MLIVVARKSGVMTTEAPGTRCPACGASQECITGINAIPRTGDYAVCWECSAVNVITDGPGLRPPTEEEIKRLEAEAPEHFQEILDGIRERQGRSVS